MAHSSFFLNTKSFFTLLGMLLKLSPLYRTIFFKGRHTENRKDTNTQLSKIQPESLLFIPYISIFTATYFEKEDPSLRSHHVNIYLLL